MNPPYQVLDQTYKKIKIVNGKVIQDIELHNTTNNEKQVMEGHYDNIPIHFEIRYKKHYNKKHYNKTKHSRKPKRGSTINKKRKTLHKRK